MRGVLVGGQRTEVVVMRVDRIERGRVRGREHRAEQVRLRPGVVDQLPRIVRPDLGLEVGGDLRGAVREEVVARRQSPRRVDRPVPGDVLGDLAEDLVRSLDEAADRELGDVRPLARVVDVAQRVVGRQEAEPVRAQVLVVRRAEERARVAALVRICRVVQDAPKRDSCGVVTHDDDVLDGRVDDLRVVEQVADRPDDVVGLPGGAGVRGACVEGGQDGAVGIHRNHRASGRIRSARERLQPAVDVVLGLQAVQVTEPLRCEEIKRARVRRHRGHRLRHACAGALRVGAGRRQRNRSRRLDAQHPRVVAVGAVEARDLDRVRAAFGRDHRHLFVGEPAVVGDVQGGLAERVLRHVGERLGRDRLRPLAELERDLPCGWCLCAGMRRSQRCDRRPVDDEVVVHVQVAEVDRQLLARRGVDLEVVAVRAARGVAEVERVRLGRLRGLGLAVPRLSGLRDHRRRRIRRGDGSVEARRGDLRGGRLGSETQPRLRSEAELVARVGGQAVGVPGELVLGRLKRRFALERSRAAGERRRVRDVPRAWWEVHADRAVDRRIAAVEQDGDVVGHRPAVAREILDREAGERQRLPVVGRLQQDGGQQILECRAGRQALDEIPERDVLSVRVLVVAEVLQLCGLLDRPCCLGLGHRVGVRALEGAGRAVEDRELRAQRDAAERDASERGEAHVDPAERDPAERSAGEVDAAERDAAQRRADGDAAERDASERDASERDASERDPPERHALQPEAQHRLSGEARAVRAAEARLLVDVGAPVSEVLSLRRARDAAQRNTAEGQAAERDPAERNASERARFDVDLVQRDAVQGRRDRRPQQLRQRHVLRRCALEFVVQREVRFPRVREHQRDRRERHSTEPVLVEVFGREPDPAERNAPERDSAERDASERDASEGDSAQRCALGRLGLAADRVERDADDRSRAGARIRAPRPCDGDRRGQVRRVRSPVREGVPSADRRQVDLVGPVREGRPDFEVLPARVADERDSRPVRRPARVGVEDRAARQVRRTRAVRGVDRPDRPAAGCSGPLAEEGDLLPVGRPVRVRVATGLVRQPRRSPGSVRVLAVDLFVPVAVRHEGELRAVRRPGGAGLVRGRVGDVHGSAAGRVDDEDVVLLDAAAVVRDLRAVGRPRRLQLDPGVGSQPREAGAVDVHHVDVGATLAVARERDLRPVRRDRGHVVGRRVVGESRLRRPVGVHPVDLELAVPVRLEDDVTRGRRRSSSLEREVGPVTWGEYIRARILEAGSVDGVHDVHADRVARLEADVVHGVRRTERMPELERPVRPHDLSSSQNVVRAVAGWVRPTGPAVRVVSGSGIAGGAVVVVGPEREGRGEPEDHVLAGVLDPVVVVVEEDPHRRRAARVFGNREGDVEVLGVVLEPHRYRASLDREVIGRRVRPFARADHPVDRGRRNCVRPLEDDRWIVVRLRDPWERQCDGRSETGHAKPQVVPD